MVSNWQLIREIWNDDGYDAHERIIALEIAMHRNERTLRCDPSAYRLAKRLSIPRRTIVGIIKRLKSKKLFFTVKKAGIGFPRGVLYYFLYDWQEAYLSVKAGTIIPDDRESWEVACIKKKSGLGSTSQFASNSNDIYD